MKPWLDLKSYSLEVLSGIKNYEIASAIDTLISSFDKPVKKALLIPPDITRKNSGAGVITSMFFSKLEPLCHCDILPALGSHMPMTRNEQIDFFGGDIPADRFFVHNWREDVVTIGYVPAEYVSVISDNEMNDCIPIEVIRNIINGGYDIIISIGQVVPHEVVGMANYTKNILVGCGGIKMINSSHMLSVFYGTEKLLGIDNSPVRKLFDYVQENFLKTLPLVYVMTVTTQCNPDTESGKAKTLINGLYIGNTRDCFEKAVSLSQQLNITRIEPKIEKCVVFLDPEEFRTSWVGNKAVYRTRKALAKNAELIILAPGFERFGEDEEIDRLIRKYGFQGRQKLLSMLRETDELFSNMSVVAHLVQGSTDGNFSITYCTKPVHKDEINSVGYNWADIDDAIKIYGDLKDGWNEREGKYIYYVSNPALGLWM